MTSNDSNDSSINIITADEGKESLPLIETNEIKDECNSQQIELGKSTKLIQLVKTYPELYDKTHHLYCSNAHRGILWNKIAEELGGGTSAKKTREQFSYLRTKFRNECEARKKGIKRALVPDPDATNCRQPLFVYEQLTFLEEIFEKEELKAAQEMEKNVENESTVVKAENGLISPIPEAATMVFVESIKDETVTVAKKLSPKESSPRKRKLQKMQNSAEIPLPSSSGNVASSSSTFSSQFPASSTTVPSINAFDASLFATINNINSQSQSQFNLNNHVPPAAPTTTPTPTPEEDEECKIFGRQVTMDLQKLDSHTRMIVRYKISNILLEHYIKQCENQGHRG